MVLVAKCEKIEDKIFISYGIYYIFVDDEIRSEPLCRKCVQWRCYCLS